MSLADEHAVHIQKGTPPLSEEEIADLSCQIPDWTVYEKSMERTFTVADFARAMEFANKVAEIAQSEDHHPDLYISWGKVRIEFSTHKIGGLSRNDFILAAKIDQMSEK